MNDLIENLRRLGQRTHMAERFLAEDMTICIKAADEIKRLGAKNAELLELVDFALDMSEEGMPLRTKWQKRARELMRELNGIEWKKAEREFEKARGET